MRFKVNNSVVVKPGFEEAFEARFRARATTCADNGS